MPVRSMLALIAALALSACAEEIVCPVVKDAWISSVGKERDTNMGAAPRIKLKGPQEYALLGFDVSKLKGRKIVSAQLRFAFAEGRKWASEERGTDLRWFTVSTIGQDWNEGAGTNYSLDYDQEGACFNYAAFDKKEWAYPGSEQWDVSYGNGNSLRCDVDGGHPKDGWFHVPVETKLIQALVAGASDGLVLMDGSVFISTNAFLHSRESEAKKAPYLTVVVEGEDTAAPKAPAAVKLEPAPDRAGLDYGAARIAFTVPEDAFAYHLALDGKPVGRWQIPFAAKAGTKQEIVLEYLPPQQPLKLELIVADAAGNRSPAANAEGTASDFARVPRLPRMGWRPRGAEPPVLGGKLKVWAFPELSKLDPQSGEIVLEAMTEDAPFANSVWDGETKTVRLAAARGEIAGFQLALHALDGQASGISAKLSDLDDIGVKTWRAWFLMAGERWVPEYAIPVKDGENLAIPAADNKVPGQQAAVLAVDLIVPADAKAGERTAKVEISAEGLGKLELTLKLVVHDVVIPKETHFIPELNCYQGPLGEAGSEAFFDAFRIAHYHRCSPNRVPHSHNGRTHQDWTPQVDEKGKVTDWSRFDKNLGPLLDGSAFKDNPRAGVPIPVLYLPFNESWPLPIQGNYKPGEDVPLAGNGWRWKHNILARPPAECFPDSYKAAFRTCVAEFVRHFEEKGWNRTWAEAYNNNKVQYGKVDVIGEDGKPVLDEAGKRKKQPGMTGTAWTLDEPQFWLDWEALRLYSRLFHDGLQDVKTVKFGYRGDISRPNWQGSSFDGLMEILVAGGGQFEYLPLMRDHKRRMPTTIFAYGGCNAPDKSNLQSAAWCLKAYAHEADGVLPW